MVLRTRNPFSSSVIWSVILSKAAFSDSLSRCISTGVVWNLSGSVAPSSMESWNEYLLMYPFRSSGAPNVWKVLCSYWLIGVPVRP